MKETILAQFDDLLPLACAWVETQEQFICENGVALNASQIQDAKEIGITHPNRVRLLSVEQIPAPTNPLLAMAAQEFGLLTPFTIGLSLRYGIFIRADQWGKRSLVVHELVHTWQYERLGGIAPFLRQYLLECVTIGYPLNALEQEAIALENKICQVP